MDQLDYKNRQLSLAEGLSRKQAERYLKANLSNVEIMKNRIKALSSQAEYNQYRQKYQSAKIQRHHEIHQGLIRQKAEVKAVLGSRDDTLIKKQAKQKMNKQIKQKLNEALDKMKKSRIDQYRELKEKSQQNYQILSKRRLRELQAKRQKKEEVAKMETSIKQSLFRYSEEKKNELKTLKELQKKSMLQLNEHVNRQLAQLSNKQKDLIHLSSSSFKASRVLDQQYTILYERRSFGKDIKLPGIKKCLDSKKTATNNTQ